MKLKPFWNELIQIEEIRIKIDDHGLDKKEKKELLDVAYQTFDIKIMNVILTQLPQEKHQAFLDTFSRKPHHPKLLAFLKEEIEDIEDKIKETAKEVKEEILDQLKK